MTAKRKRSNENRTMKTELVGLAQITVNASNPRNIKNGKFEKLTDSLLALPKMLELRPIVVDNSMTALGGNMRCRALAAIAAMTEPELKRRLSGIRDFQKKAQAERDSLVDYWLRWRRKPAVPVIKAGELTEAEQREFVIKDNAAFGEWDWDMLANEKKVQFLHVFMQHNINKQDTLCHTSTKRQ